MLYVPLLTVFLNQLDNTNLPHPDCNVPHCLPSQRLEPQVPPVCHQVLQSAMIQPLVMEVVGQEIVYPLGAEHDTLEGVPCGCYATGEGGRPPTQRSSMTWCQTILTSPVENNIIIILTAYHNRGYSARSLLVGISPSQEQFLQTFLVSLQCCTEQRTSLLIVGSVHRLSSFYYLKKFSEISS